MSASSLLLLVGLLGGALPRENTGFTPGHIFVSVIEAEACFKGRSWIIEVAPETGAWSVFADSEDDGLCVPTGLRFTAGWHGRGTTHDVCHCCVSSAFVSLLGGSAAECVSAE